MALANRIWGIILSVAAAALVFSAPAHAQYSAGYKFLEAIKKQDGDAITDALDTPGSTLINVRDITTGQTALHLVTERRDVTWINYLTYKGANPNVRDVKGVTPLVLAAQLGFVDGVQALVDAGAQVDIPNSTGETPLIAAVLLRNIPMMRVLLKAGANPERADSSGRTARDYALLDGASSLISEIERNEKSDSEQTTATYGPSF